VKYTVHVLPTGMSNIKKMFKFHVLCHSTFLVIVVSVASMSTSFSDTASGHT
jgi:uncharacterized protein YqhQ